MSKIGYITIEKVKYIIDKTDTSYEEAEKSLKRNKGDKEKAIRWIESQRRTIFTKTKNAIIGLFFYKFVIKRREKMYINIPLWLLAIMSLILLGVVEERIVAVVVAIILIILFTGCDIIISKREYEAKIRLKKTKRKQKEITNDSIEYKVEENEDGEYTIEVNE